MNKRQTKKTVRDDSGKRLSLYSANEHEARVFAEIRKQATLQNISINKIVINTFAKSYNLLPEESQAA